jgi:type III secretion protein N (ATPase)
MTDDHSVLGDYLDRIDGASPVRLRGRVREVTGLVVKAAIPEGAVGDLVRIEARDGAHRQAEIVGFVDELAVLMPLGPVDGIGPDSAVEATGDQFSIRCGEDLLGRVLDGLGKPVDGGPALTGQRWQVDRPAPDPLRRKRIDAPLPLGVRAIDGLLTVGEGQRIGLFAGSGVGKSTLLGQVARNAEADVVVVCLVGERGREVRDFIEDVLGDEGLQRSVVVCATSDAPSLVRLKSAWVATAVAEYFRDRGQRVLLLMDSVTRFARAQREVGLAAGEPPARRGYPPSVFSMLPRLLERTGNGVRGSITAIYTVLVAGGDMEEPIADEVRGILDGHILLSRELAHRNHWPAIDVLPSLSRVMNDVVSEEHRETASRFREVLAAYESKRDLIALGAYEYGSDERVDYAIDVIDQLEDFLQQGMRESTPFEDAVDRMWEIVG